MKKIINVLVILIILSGCSKFNSPIDDSEYSTLEDLFASIHNGESLKSDLPRVDNSDLNIFNDSSLNLNGRSTTARSIKPTFWEDEEEEEDDDGSGRIRVKFKWPGTLPGGGQCEAGKGICIIYTYRNPTSPISLVGYDELGYANSVFTIAENKLMIESLGENDLLTSDGYLAIPDFMPISQDLIIKPAVYKGKNNSVIVDIIKIKN